jgi:Cellulase (glycosyl hydrolase family 5)
MPKFGFLFMLAFLAAPCIAQNFRVVGTRILDPEGREFVIKGTNVNGPHWPWARPTVPDADLMVNTWRFNTVRVNAYPSLATNGCCRTNNTDLDAIVRTFTGRRVVTQIENHDFTGRYPNAAELETLKSWWVDLATRYRGNPYVWFNIMNEPGNSAQVPETWRTAHEEVVRAIRATGAENIIVLDGHGFGQENGFSNGESGSGILTYGPYFIEKYRNITFSLHLYANWIYGETRLRAYLDAVAAKGLSIHAGEYGSGDDYSRGVASDLFKVALERNLGRIVWQWFGGDIHDLTSGGIQGGGWEVNRTDGIKPTNLSFVGNLIWLDNRGELRPNAPDLVPPSGPWLLNGGFENQLEGWINFGQAASETEAANRIVGSSRSLRVNAGSQSGAGQPIFLLPNRDYVLTAWGRNSAVPNPTSSVGINYKVPGNNATLIWSLGFTETEFTRKQLRFRTPATLTETLLFIYKGDAAPIFYVDEISLNLVGDPLGAADHPLAKEFGLYPNPADGATQLEWTAAIGHLERAELYNAVGQAVPVPQQPGAMSLRLDTRGLAAGQYWLKIQWKDGVVTKPLVIR